MEVRQAYDIWADQYDTNDNRTRDLEAFALIDNLAHLQFDSCLEIGCGTGKNTVWLQSKSKELLAVDLSDKMLFKAKKKLTAGNVQFLQADINRPWTFITRKYDLLVFSLVLEHIENLDAIFSNASDAVKHGGIVYLGELHPFKQYTGTKARFETAEGVQTVTCFNHHISEFTASAKKHRFEIVDIKEYFDGNNQPKLPRILTLLFRKI